MPTQSVLHQIRSLGYVVKEFRINGSVEYRAVPVRGCEPQIARCDDGEDNGSAYIAAYLLAEAVGIELEG